MWMSQEHGLKNSVASFIALGMDEQGQDTCKLHFSKKSYRNTNKLW